MLDLSDGQVELNAAERELVLAAREGRRAQCRDGTVRGEVIRQLALDQFQKIKLQPSGLAIYGATITGVVDLEGCDIAKPLLFFNCKFGWPAHEIAEEAVLHLDQDKAPRTAAPPHSREQPSPLVLRDARLRRLGLYGCQINGAVRGEGVEISTNIFMKQAVFNGPLHLRGAKIGGAFTAEEAQFIHDGIALSLDSAKIDGPIVLRDARVSGGIRMRGAQVSGGILAEALHIAADNNIALNADGARLGGVWMMTGAQIEGSLLFRGASLTSLIFDGIRCTHTENALIADGSHVKDSWNMSSARLQGEVSCQNAVIGSQFQAIGTRFLNAGGFALHADLLRSGGNVILRKADFDGQVCCPGLRVEGQFVLTDARIDHDELALRGDGSRITGGWFMSRLKARGLIRFPASKIGNQLRLRGAIITVSEGPSLLANGVTVNRDAELSDGFTAAGAIVLDQSKIGGMLDLRGSRLTSASAARGAQLADEPQLARVLSDAVKIDAVHKNSAVSDVTQRYDDLAFSFVDGSVSRLVMPDTKDARPEGIVDLSGANASAFADFDVAWAEPVSRWGRREKAKGSDQAPFHINLDGFTYEHLENPAGHKSASMSGQPIWKVRARWLGGQSADDLDTHFKPQPWLQLASRLSQQGHDNDAAQIMIARKRQQRKSRSVKGWAKLQSLLLDSLARYGYSPWRTVGWMALLICGFASIWAMAATHCARTGCHDEQVFVRPLTGNFSHQTKAELNLHYPDFQPLAFSFDVFIPVVNFGYQGYWRPNTAFAPLVTVPLPKLVASTFFGKDVPSQFTITTGGLLYILFVLEMIFGLLITSLAVTGFTGLLRTDKS